MNKKEVAILIKKVDAFYPNRMKMDEPRLLIDTWHQVLKDSSYELSEEKLLNYVKENKFPPSIADLIAEVKTKKELTEEEKKQLRIKELKDMIRLTRDYFAMTNEEHIYDDAVRELKELG